MKVTKELLELADRALEQLGIQHLSDKVYANIDILNARGADKATAVAAAIFKACKDNLEPVTLTTICRVLGTSQKCVFKLLKKHGWLTDLTSPEDYIDPVLNRIDFLSDDQKQKLKELALDFLKQMEKIHTRPLTKAVTAIYLASVKLNIPLTQQKLEEVMGVTQVTIRNMITRLFGGRSDKSIRTILKNS